VGGPVRFRPVRFRGVTWVVEPRGLVGRLVVWLLMLAVALTMVVGAIVRSFRGEPEAWYFYPLLVVGLAAWLGFAALIAGAGVYVREGGVVVVNPFHASSLRWDEIERFSLDDDPRLRSLGLNFGRVHRRDGGSTTILGIRPYGDPRSKRQAHEAIAFLNQTLAAHANSV
jgi:hypothetical protein